MGRPLSFVDPTGHFSEGAIAEYIQNNYKPEEWGGIYLNWYNDKQWWAMLLAALAGDVLFGTLDGGTFRYRFNGVGKSAMSGCTDLEGGSASLEGTRDGMCKQLGGGTTHDGTPYKLWSEPRAFGRVSCGQGHQVFARPCPM